MHDIKARPICARIQKPDEGESVMPYILIMLFLAASGPPRLDHVDSVRFDSERACEAALKNVQTNASLAANFSDTRVSIACLPAE
jgi:hypothetical protein